MHLKYNIMDLNIGVQKYHCNAELGVSLEKAGSYESRCFCLKKSCFCLKKVKTTKTGANHNLQAD